MHVSPVGSFFMADLFRLFGKACDGGADFRQLFVGDGTALRRGFGDAMVQMVVEQQ